MVYFSKRQKKNDTVRFIIAIENDQLSVFPIAEMRYIVNSMNDIIEIICRINFIKVIVKGYGRLGDIPSDEARMGARTSYLVLLRYA
jgi:hypothetical protein